MFIKTMKITVGMIALTAFLSACSSTSTTEPTSTASTTTPPPVATTTGSNQNTVVETSAPTETVFYFDFDSAVLRADSRALLTAHAVALKANSTSSVRLEGHADERGTREYNIALGERRALAVRSYLLSEGVTADIEVVSYGEEQPAVASSNEFAWQQNRRVEIKY